MARGWESKAVEDQVEQAAQSRDVQAQPAKPPGGDIAQTHKLGGLRLMRSQVNEQLQRSQTVSQRQMLHQRLQAIEEEIVSLEAAS
jgi:RNA polymerase-interacting CarD/CdnL/TRCF family regulator